MPTSAVYARSLFEVWQEAPAGQRDAVLENFLRLLAANREADLISRIFEELQRLEAAAQAERTVTVVSARPLPDATVDEVATLVRPVLPVAPERSAVVTDPSIVGGLIVRTPSLEIDASVRRVLSRLQEEQSR